MACWRDTRTLRRTVDATNGRRRATVHELDASLEDPQIFGQRHLVLRVHEDQVLDEEQADDVLPFSGIHGHPRKAMIKNVPHHRKGQLAALLEHVGVLERRHDLCGVRRVLHKVISRRQRGP